MRFKNSFELAFPENQVTLIAGENGAGKTSILDAICISLYGKTFRTSGRTSSGYLRVNDLVNHESTKAIIRVEFENHGHNYVVTRDITQNSSHGELFEDGESKALGQRVYEYTRKRAIGLDWEGFRKSTIVLQGEMSSLTELEPGKRKDAFVILFGLDKYFDYEKRAQEKAKVKQFDVDKVEEANKLLSSDIQRIPEAKQQIRDSKRKVVALQKRKLILSEKVDRKKKEKDGLEGDYSRFIMVDEKLSGLNNQIRDSGATERKNERELKELQNLEGKLPNLQASYNEFLSLEGKFSMIRPVSLEYYRLEKDISQKVSSQKRVTKWLGEIVSDIAQTGHEISSLRKQIPSLRRVNAVDNALERIQKGKSSLEKREAEYSAEIKRIGDSISSLKTDLERVKDKSECPVCLQKITDPEEVKRHYSDEISNLLLEKQEKVGKLKAARLKLEAVKASATRLKATLKDLQQRSAKRGEVKREQRRLSTLNKRKMAEKTEIGKLKIQIRETRSEQAKLSFNPSQYDELDSRIHQLRKRKVAEQFTNAKTKLSRLPGVEEELSESRDRTSNLRSERGHWVAELNKFGKIQVRYDKAKAHLQRAQEVLNENNNELAAGLKDREHLESKLKELLEKERILEDNKGKIRRFGEERIVLEELKDVFASIPENILRRLRPSIEKEGTDLINDLSNNELTALNIEEETLNVAATINGQVRAIHYFSGGQKTRISMALRVAISRILSKLPQTEEHAFAVMQTLFVDEGDFGNLDEAGIREAIAVVRNLTKEFSRVILISHIDDIREIFHGYTVEVLKTSAIESGIRIPGIDELEREQLVTR